MTISGFAFRSVESSSLVEHLSYSINQIILDRDDITDIASCVDVQQINNACFNFVQSVFKEDEPVLNELRNFPQSPNLFVPAIAS